MIVTVNDLANGILENAERIKSYHTGGDGRDGTCDCIGLILGSMRLIGMTYKGMHGSNYFARYWTVDLHHVTKASQLQAGQVVYKAKKPGDSGYDLPARYDDSPDRLDYYHIGYVLSVSPLKIAHCSAGGMHYDTKLGKWAYAGYIKGVDYKMTPQEPEQDLPIGMAYVDVPNDGTVNIRAAPKGNAKILDRIQEGTHCLILEQSGDWAKVEYAQTGYVMTKFLKGENPK